MGQQQQKHTVIYLPALYCMFPCLGMWLALFSFLLGDKHVALGWRSDKVPAHQALYHFMCVRIHRGASAALSNIYLHKHNCPVFCLGEGGWAGSSDTNIAAWILDFFLQCPAPSLHTRPWVVIAWFRTNLFGSSPLRS